MIKNITSGWAGRIKNFFYQPDQEYIAIIQVEAGSWSLFRYQRQADGWHREEVAGRQEGVWDDEPVLSGEKLADWVAMELGRKGWQQVPLLFAVPEGELIGYVLNLPPHLDREQQAEAAFWELDDKLTVKALDADDFACICIPLAEADTGSRCAIWAVRRDYLQELQGAFATAELHLADVIAGGGVWGEHEVGDVVSAYLADTQHQQGFCHHPATTPDKRRLTVCCLLMLIVPLCLWLAMDICSYEQAKAAATGQTEELARLQPEKHDMEEAAEKCRRIEQRERLQASLQERSMPGYSLLVHLGANTCEGVFLTEVKFTDHGKALHLTGQAVTYDALAEFVSGLEGDKVFCPQGVRLENSALTQGSAAAAGTIAFSLLIDKEARNGRKDMGKAEKS